VYSFGMTSSSLPQTLSVVRIGHVWRIVTQGRLTGQFQFRVDAEEAALRLARSARERGEIAEVIVQERWGEMSPLVGF
jgi:hypothetical protein